MFHNILGFGGRMGRLEYFLVSLVFALFMALLILALVLGLAPHGLTPGNARASLGASSLLIVLLLVVVPIYLWFSLAFLAKRIRDIGWNPLFVILGWIGAIMIDRFVAMTVPAMALGHGSGTLAGLLLNLFMYGSLLFWPSAPTGTEDWSGNSYPGGRPDPDPRLQRPREPKPAAQPAAALAPAPVQAPSGFGRRGL